MLEIIQKLKLLWEGIYIWNDTLHNEYSKAFRWFPVIKVMTLKCDSVLECRLELSWLLYKLKMSHWSHFAAQSKIFSKYVQDHYLVPVDTSQNNYSFTLHNVSMHHNTLIDISCLCITTYQLLETLAWFLVITLTVHCF